jgi:hypothetical protein
MAAKKNYGVRVLEQFVSRLKRMTSKQRTELRKKMEKSFRRFETIEAGRTVARVRAVQQPQAKMPPCKIHKKCEFYLKMYCGENTERFACYQPPAARSAMR